MSMSACLPARRTTRPAKDGESRFEHIHDFFIIFHHFMEFIMTAKFNWIKIAVPLLLIGSVQLSEAPAAAVDSDYSGGTLTGGLILQPGSAGIRFTGDTAVTGSTNIASGPGVNNEAHIFHLTNQTGPATIEKGASVTVNGGGSITQAFNSSLLVEGSLDIRNTSGNVYLGTTPAMTGTAQSALLKGTGDLYIESPGVIRVSSNASGAGTGKDAFWTYNIVVDGGNFTINSTGNGSNYSNLYFGTRNYLNVDILNGGTMLLKTTDKNRLHFCGGGSSFNGSENKKVVFNIEDGDLVLDSGEGRDIQMGMSAVSGDHTRRVEFHIGEKGTLTLDENLMFGTVSGSTPIGTALIDFDGGTLYAKEDAITLDSRIEIAFASESAIQVDETLTIGSAIQGSAGAVLSKLGAGTLVFSDADEFHGSIGIHEGALALNDTTLALEDLSMLLETSLILDGDVSLTAETFLGEDGEFSLLWENEELYEISADLANLLTYSGNGIFTFTGAKENIPEPASAILMLIGSGWLCFQFSRKTTKHSII